MNIVLMALFALLVGEVSARSAGMLSTGITYKIENIGAQLGASGNIRWFRSEYPGDYRRTIPVFDIKKSLTPEQIQWFKDGIKQSPHDSCLGSTFKKVVTSTRPVGAAVPNVGLKPTPLVVTPIAPVVASVIGNAGLAIGTAVPNIGLKPISPVVTPIAPVIGNAGLVMRAMKYGCLATGMATASYYGLLKYREYMAPEAPKPQTYVQKMQSLVQAHPYLATGSLGAAMAIAYVAYQNKDKITNTVQQSIRALTR